MTGVLGPAEIESLQRLAGNAAVTIALQRDKGSPTTSPAAPPKAPAQPSVEARAAALQNELQPIFSKMFGKYGSKEHFAPRGLKIVPDKQDKATVKALDEEAEEQLRRLMKMAPESVVKALQHLYKVEDKHWPPDAYARGIDEHTRLLPDDRRQLLAGILLRDMVEFANPDVGAIYSVKAKTMLIKQSNASAGALIHEMAHGCEDDAWIDAMVMVRGLGMKNATQLSEGMTCLVADAVAFEWAGNDKTIPSTGYEDDSTFRDTARQFEKDVGEAAAFEAFFAGSIAVDANDPSILILGQGKKQKKWHWPW
jgi:hypothetical protein